MSGVANDMQKHIAQMRASKNPKPVLPYNNLIGYHALNNLRNEYQRKEATDVPDLRSPKKDLNRILRDYFQRKAYFKDGRWIDSIDDDWDEQEAKEWWAKNGGLPDDQYISTPNSQDVAEAVIRKLRRL